MMTCVTKISKFTDHWNEKGFNEFVKNYFKTTMAIYYINYHILQSGNVNMDKIFCNMINMSSENPNRKNEMHRNIEIFFHKDHNAYFLKTHKGDVEDLYGQWLDFTYEDVCNFFRNADRKCSCSISTLMAKGCDCGAFIYGINLKVDYSVKPEKKLRARWH